MYKLASFFFLFLFLINNNLYANDKIVFININYIFTNSNAGKKLYEQIDQKNKQIQIEINKIKTELESEQKQIFSQKNVLSVEEYNKKITNLENKIIEMNTKIKKKQDELNLFKNKVEKNFSKQLNMIIEEYSVQNSIDIIFKKENLLMAKKNLDITENIFNLFNEKIDIIKLD